MRFPRFAVTALFAAIVVATPAIGAPRSTAPQDVATTGTEAAWLGPDGEPVPFESDAQILDFLRDATVVSIETIPVGVTEPRKVLLELDGVRAHAIFRDVELTEERIQLSDGSFHMQLRDSALFEVAAYRLATLLGLDNVPPTVVRQIDRTKGSMQLWVEGAMTETNRRERRLRPIDYPRWLEQMRAMSLFDCVAGNIDRHTGNYLMDSRGKLWMIDHTRAFQMFVADWSPGKIGLCDREIWERLQELDEEALRDALGDVLTPFEIEHLAERLEGVVAHIQAQIAARGEKAVII